MNKPCGRPLEDLIGNVFDRWTVIERDFSRKSRPYWICKCSCEKETIKSIAASALKSKNSKSCGCLGRIIIGLANTKHGLKNTREYNIWKGIKERCLNKNSKNYHNYGGRGISMYKSWITSPEKFITYIKSLDNYNNGKRSIDRINNDSNYEPGNLRWATSKEQARNRRCMYLSVEVAEYIRYLYTIGLSQNGIGKWLNIRPSSVSYIINENGWSSEGDSNKIEKEKGDSLAVNQKIEAFGEVKTMREWSLDIRCNTTLKNLHTRIRRDWSIEKAISTHDREPSLVCTEIARQIRKLNKMGVKSKDIAEIYCITIPCINDILANRTWKETLE